jgi:hypothetical protein
MREGISRKAIDAQKDVMKASIAYHLARTKVYANSYEPTLIDHIQAVITNCYDEFESDSKKSRQCALKVIAAFIEELPDVLTGIDGLIEDNLQALIDSEEERYRIPKELNKD